MDLGTSRGISLERAAIWLALASVAVFLVWSAIRIRDITATMYANSDIASAPVLAELLSERGSGKVTLGFYPWLESLFALRWTRWVPDHIEFWKAAPFVVYGATVVLVGWIVMRAASRKAGLVVALAMAAPAPIVIYMLGAPNQRLPALVHTVILAAFLVTLPSLPRWARWKQGLWAFGLALTLAPGVSSDPLLVAAAVLPFLAAVGYAYVGRLLQPAAAALAAGACVAGVLGGRLIEAVAESDGIVFADTGFEMASGARALSNAGLLLEDVALFAQGHFGNGVVRFDAFNATRELVAIAAIGAVIVFAFVIVRRARPILLEAARPIEQRLLFVYWVVSIVAVSAAFVITTAPYGINAVRYLTTLWPGLLILVVIVYGRRAVAGLALLAAGCAVLGSAALSKDLYTPGAGPRPNAEEARLVERFAAENDLDHGYAGYWDAAPLTFQSGFGVRVYPIRTCGPPPDGHCPFHVHTIENWYVPEPGARTFYVVGDQSLYPPLGPPPADWGRPFEEARLGHLTVYAFDYDIASQLRPLEPGEVPLPAAGSP
jgi:hypothetical protein